MRQSKHIGMANIAQSVNVISPLMTHKKGLTKQTTWWPLLLFCKYMHGSTLAVHLRCQEYEGSTKPKWLRGTMDTPWLDVSAAIDDEGVVSLAVVNIHADKDFEVNLEGVTQNATVTVYTVSGEDIAVVNTAEDENKVGIQEGTWDASEGSFVFPKHSLSMLRWSTSTTQ